MNGLTSLLVSRLDHRDAIVRLNLLKLIKVNINPQIFIQVLACFFSCFVWCFECFCFDSQAVYEHHPKPKQLIVENGLPQKLQVLIEERRDGQSSGGQVLVKQLATSLLKALYINTVL